MAGRLQPAATTNSSITFETVTGFPAAAWMRRSRRDSGGQHWCPAVRLLSCPPSRAVCPVAAMNRLTDRGATSLPRVRGGIDRDTAAAGDGGGCAFPTATDYSRVTRQHRLREDLSACFPRRRHRCTAALLLTQKNRKAWDPAETPNDWCWVGSTTGTGARIDCTWASIQFGSVAAVRLPQRLGAGSPNGKQESQEHRAHWQPLARNHRPIQLQP